jgi:hypothetical protein
MPPPWWLPPPPRTHSCEHMTSEANVIYSPVPQTDFIFEWQRAYRKVQSNADATNNRIDAQFKFYF